jgi:hypothetical protein
LANCVRSSTVEAIPTLLYGIEVSYYSLIVCGLQKVVIVSTNLKLLIEMRFTDEYFLKCPSLQKDVGTFVTSRNIPSIEVNTYCHE